MKTREYQHQVPRKHLNLLLLPLLVELRELLGKMNPFSLMLFLLCRLREQKTSEISAAHFLFSAKELITSNSMPSKSLYKID